MRIAICDDNIEYIKTIEEYLDKLKMPKIEYDVFQSGEEIVFEYENNEANYDAIFLDMEMDGINGIQTANRIRGFDEYVIIVFITNHKKYMQESFECAPFRFLVKPIDYEEFEDVFDKVCQKLSKQRKVLNLTVNKIRVRLFCDDIVYFESESHWVWVHTKDNDYKVCTTITSLLDKMDENMFLRVHKSFVVNFNYIRVFKENSIELYDCEKIIPVSRSYRKNVISEFVNFKERKYLV